MRFTRRRYQIGALLGATGLAAAIFATTAVADPTVMDGQSEADAIVKAAKSTGSIIVARDGDKVEHYGGGTTTFGKDDAPDGDDQFRIASNTKMFVSTVLLQLSEEGKLDIDDAIGEHLPGLVVGEGIDESKITVRHLLQHTSGLADNLSLDVIADPILQWKPPTPEEMVEKGLRHGAQSAPGETYSYSNTGFTILGLLVEKLTDQRIGDAIDERISQPLGLEETSFAYPGQKEMQGPHMRAYLGVPPALFEVTGHEPGIWTAAGALVSSGNDVTTFVDALMGGELLNDETLKEMQKTFPDTNYGLGLHSFDVPCGTVWGHTGHVAGYVSYSFTDGNGKSAFVGVNTSLLVFDAREEISQALTSAICGQGETPSDSFTDMVGDELKAAEKQAEGVEDNKSKIYEKN